MPWPKSIRPPSVGWSFAPAPTTRSRSSSTASRFSPPANNITGVRMDQYVGVGTLKKGRNRILVKVCQDEQTASFAQTWGFQLRVCDSLGGAVPIQIVGVRKQRELQR